MLIESYLESLNNDNLHTFSRNKLFSVIYLNSFLEKPSKSNVKLVSNFIKTFFNKDKSGSNIVNVEGNCYISNSDYSKIILIPSNFIDKPYLLMFKIYKNKSNYGFYLEDLLFNLLYSNNSEIEIVKRDSSVMVMKFGDKYFSSNSLDSYYSDNFLLLFIDRYFQLIKKFESLVSSKRISVVESTDTQLDLSEKYKAKILEFISKDSKYSEIIASLYEDVFKCSIDNSKPDKEFEKNYKKYSECKRRIEESYNLIEVVDKNKEKLDSLKSYFEKLIVPMLLVNIESYVKRNLSIENILLYNSEGKVTNLMLVDNEYMSKGNMMEDIVDLILLLMYSKVEITKFLSNVNSKIGESSSVKFKDLNGNDFNENINIAISDIIGYVILKGIYNLVTLIETFENNNSLLITNSKTKSVNLNILINSVDHLRYFISNEFNNKLPLEYVLKSNKINLKDFVNLYCVYLKLLIE